MTTPNGPEPSDELSDPKPESVGPVIALTKPWRVVLAAGSVGLAIARTLVWREPLDALSVGLLGVAVLLLFFDIEKIEWGGVTASRKKARLAKAVREAPNLQVPPEPIELPPAPAIPKGGLVSHGYGGVVHREPFDLDPPTDPAQRLVWATEKIRVELIVLAGTSGNLPHSARWDEYDGIVLARHLAARGVLPQDLVLVISIALDARGDFLSGALKAGVLAAADSLALDVLQKLREVKHQYVRVRDPDVTLYRDQSLSTIFQETAGVMLVSLDDRGRVLHTSVYPRQFQYGKGRFTSWEWMMERAFKEPAWYRDPTSGQATMAWGSSATFVGREYPEQWGLEYNLPRPDAGLD